jgi:hypothetical protein
MRRIVPKQSSGATTDCRRTGLGIDFFPFGIPGAIQGRARQGASATTNRISRSEEEML